MAASILREPGCEGYGIDWSRILPWLSPGVLSFVCAAVGLIAVKRGAADRPRLTTVTCLFAPLWVIIALIIGAELSPPSTCSWF